MHVTLYTPTAAAATWPKINDPRPTRPPVRFPSDAQDDLSVCLTLSSRPRACVRVCACTGPCAGTIIHLGRARRTGSRKGLGAAPAGRREKAIENLQENRRRNNATRGNARVSGRSVLLCCFFSREQTKPRRFDYFLRRLAKANRSAFYEYMCVFLYVMADSEYLFS